MQLKNCTECGRVFVHPSREICPACYEAEEQDFQKVKEFLRDKAHSSVDDVSDKTGVAKKRVIKFVRQGRLTAEGLDIELFLSCEGCGEPISEGRYCKECRDKLVKGLTEEMTKTTREEPQPKKEDITGKMHLQHRRR